MIILITREIKPPNNMVITILIMFTTITNSQAQYFNFISDKAANKITIPQIKDTAPATVNSAKAHPGMNAAPVSKLAPLTMSSKPPIIINTAINITPKGVFLTGKITPQYQFL